MKRLSEVCDLIAGYAFKSKDFGDYKNKVIKITQINPMRVDMEHLQGVDISNYNFENLKKYIAHKGDYLLAMTGATIGKLGRITTDGSAYINQRVLMFRPKKEVNSDFLFYVLCQYDFAIYIQNHIDSDSAQPNISANTIGKFEFNLPPLETQKKIASILSVLDEKIEVNTAISRKLEEVATAIFKEWFSDKDSSSKFARRKCCADEIFDISIGKTPPRNEHQWFSKNQKDNIWVSISDMGNSGMYIANSSEYLTDEAIAKHNIKIVPNNTVILSFKLTVGRVAITDGEMTTNEAIAHFKTDNPKIVEYLYCYLKDFSYQTMGSTSSIATAINSKIIKSMPFIIPGNEELERFHGVVSPIFEKIKINQHENIRLSTIRDALLPRLLSGEIDVSSLEI